MFVVKYCTRSYDDVVKHDEASFETEQKAEEYADTHNTAMYDWYEIVEEQ